MQSIFGSVAKLKLYYKFNFATEPDLLIEWCKYQDEDVYERYKNHELPGQKIIFAKNIYSSCYKITKKSAFLLKNALFKLLYIRIKELKNNDLKTNWSMIMR